MALKQQNGSTLVVSLVLLTIITLVAVYSLEGSNIQAKMVANSLFTTLTYQECRNEQEANVRFFNDNGGIQRNNLITLRTTGSTFEHANGPLTTDAANPNPPKSTMEVSWSYIADAPASRSGYNIDIESQSRAYLYENDCDSTFRFASNSQTLGAVVEGLEQAGNIN